MSNDPIMTADIRYAQAMPRGLASFVAAGLDGHDRDVALAALGRTVPYLLGMISHELRHSGDPMTPDEMAAWIKGWDARNRRSDEDLLRDRLTEFARQVGLLPLPDLLAAGCAVIGDFFSEMIEDSSWLASRGLEAGDTAADGLDLAIGLLRDVAAQAIADEHDGEK